MARKVFNINIELNIHAVSCPGVWLCPNGKITMSIYMLGAITNTLPVEPSFPLLFHERFIFTKTIKTARFLTDIHSNLSNEQIYIELIQWSDGDMGLVLATFEASVLEVLYPSPGDKDIIAGLDVDLLMDPTTSFPGILAPKIEISSKTTIEEILKNISHKPKKTNLINPKVVTSKNIRTERRKSPIRQKSVCHSIVNKHYNTPINKHENPHNVSFCYETPPRQSAFNYKKTGPMWRSKSGKLYQSSTKKEIQKPKLEVVDCHGHDSCEQNMGCHICSKYKSYFQNRATNCPSGSKINRFNIDDLRLQDKKDIPPRKSCFHKNKDAHEEFVDCPADLESFRELFYSNLEKFYHKLYKRAKYKARIERCGSKEMIF